jgi:5-methylcytosine-specific restriction endonuclease McrA
MAGHDTGIGAGCALCGRQKPLAFHHLIPRTCHSNKWFKKRFSRTEMSHRVVALCADCHDHIHTLFSEKELGRRFNKLEALAENEEVAKFVGWVQKQR